MSFQKKSWSPLFYTKNDKSLGESLCCIDFCSRIDSRRCGVMQSDSEITSNSTMALEIRRGKSQWWYGSFDVNGKRITQNLGVKICGQIPANLRQQGDTQFEISRTRAEAAHERVREELERKSSALDILERIHEIKTGAKVAGIALDQIQERWMVVPRKRKLADHYIKSVSRYIQLLVEYLRSNHRSATEMALIQPMHAKGFMASQDARGISAKSYNNALVALRSVFKHLGYDAGISRNPFAGIPTKEEITVHRKPFSEEEVGAVVAAAKKDNFVGPLVITGLSTAMRKADCCLLKWTSVDLSDGFISVKTAKTGETVRIPILPIFRECLENQAKLKATSRVKSDYVFPEQAMMYRVNPDGITHRVKKLFVSAGFSDALSKKRFQSKTDTKPLVGRLKTASVRDFHSLRVTWVTLALSAGVPMEIVRRVTGHRTADVVVKHYFQPGKAEFRQALESKLPALMGGTTEKALSEKQLLLQRLKSMDQLNWAKLRDEIVAEMEQ